MTTVVEGDVRFVRHPDGRVEVTQAPKIARVSLAELADPVVTATGNRITFAGAVVYRVRGWEQGSHSLLCDLVEDRRLT